MFNLKFAQVYDNSIFYEHDIKPIAEDYFNTGNQIFCVADGITRDLTDGTATPYPKTLDEIENIMKKYPNPSGAYMAAKICCDKFIEYIDSCQKIDEKNLLEIIKKVNSDILVINKNREINYLSEDLYACEAAGGKIVGNYLYCFSVGDCHITLLDENLNKVFDTSSIDSFAQYCQDHLDKLNFNWEHHEFRYMIRRFFRNNPSLKENCKDITYGALSGEKNAEYYINIYKLDLQNVKYICNYSDGCEPNFKNLSEIKKLIENPESIKNSGKEKTLVLYEKA